MSKSGIEPGGLYEASCLAALLGCKEAGTSHYPKTSGFGGGVFATCDSNVAVVA